MLLFSLAALLSSCATEGNDKKQDFIVKTTQAVPVLHQEEKEFSFIAQPFRTSELSFRVGGPTDRFDVYAGNRYKQGSIIAEIWGIERSGFFNGREKWAKGFENQRV